MLAYHLARGVALPSALLALSLTACARGSSSAAAGDASAAAASATTRGATVDSARMGRVLAGLRGGLELSDRSPARWTLAERMANYRVPGVSIAVIDGGRVA